MELTVLGCGDAFGNAGRNNTSFLLSEGGEHVLLDCGATTLVRLKHFKIDLNQISTIVISHFHGDHYGGIPFFLISSMFESPRESPLIIVGPKDVQKRVLELQEAMYAGTAEKLKELNITFLEYEQGTPLKVGDKTMQAWEVNHSPPSFPHAVRLNWNGKSIAFSGDTSWSDNLIPLSKGTDLFICECNFLNQVSFGHLSYHELLEKYKLFETKQLWLTHMAGEVLSEPNFTFKRMEDGMKIEI